MAADSRIPPLVVMPDPTPEERAALEDALARDFAASSAGSDPWWVAGVRASVLGEPEPGDDGL